MTDTMQPKNENELKGSADLAVVATDYPHIVHPCDEIEYAFVITNNGPVYAYNVVLHADFSKEICNPVGSIAGGDEWNPWKGSRLIISIFPPHYHITVRIRGTISLDARDEFVNIAKVSSSVDDPVLWNNEFKLTTRVINC